MNLHLSQSVFAQFFMLIVSQATAAPLAGFDLCFMCPLFHRAASAVSSNILRHSVSNSVEATVSTPFQSVLQRLPKQQSVPKSVSALKNVRLPVPQHHVHRHHKGILTFEINKIPSTTDLPKVQETRTSSDNIRSTIGTTTTTKKPIGRAYDHNCFFTPMNCKIYLRV